MANYIFSTLFNKFHNFVKHESDSTFLEKTKKSLCKLNEKQFSNKADENLFNNYDEINQTYERRLEMIQNTIKDCGGCSDEFSELERNVWIDWVSTLKDYCNDIHDAILYLLQQLETNNDACTKTSNYKQISQMKANQELIDLKHDLNCLVLLVQRGMQQNNWDTESLDFKTLDLQNVIGFIKQDDIKTEKLLIENNTNEISKVQQEETTMREINDRQIVDQLERKHFKTENNDKEKINEAFLEIPMDVPDILNKVSHLEKIVMLQQQRLLDSDNEKKILEKMISQYKKDIKIKEAEWNRKEMESFDYCKQNGRMYHHYLKKAEKIVKRTNTKSFNENLILDKQLIAEVQEFIKAEKKVYRAESTYATDSSISSKNTEPIVVKPRCIRSRTIQKTRTEECKYGPTK